jgi:hypothetical protein
LRVEGVRARVQTRRFKTILCCIDKSFVLYAIHKNLLKGSKVSPCTLNPGPLYPNRELEFGGPIAIWT